MNITLISCCLEEGNLSYPLGAICIQSAIQQHFSKEEMQVTHAPFTLSDDPSEAAASVDGDILGVSVYLWNRSWMDQFVYQCKKSNKKLIIFAGGPEVTANPTSFEMGLYDFLILGEGEESTTQALRNILNGEKQVGKGIVTDLEDLTMSPSFALDDIQSPILHHLADPFLTPGATVLWEMTRGCPFHCSFCFESRGQRAVRHFPFERIREELLYLIKKEVGEVYILDPTFNMDKQRTLDILNLLAEYESDIHFVFEIRAELLDGELADAFAKINCALQIGLQSNDPQVLKIANRRFDEKQFAKKIELLNKRGIPFGLDLIIGLPMDSLTAFTKSLDYAISLKPSNLDIFPLSLLPGTLVADQAKTYKIEHQVETPYTILSSPTFPKEDLAKAMQLKEAADVFFTKGQAGMWMEKLGEVLGVRPSAILQAFWYFLESYLKTTDETVDELDPFLLQETFVRGLFKKLGKQKYLPIMLSFIELHQGIAYFHEFQQSPVMELSYDLDVLAAFESMDIEEFLKKHPHQSPVMLGITLDEDGQLLFLPVQ